MCSVLKNRYLFKFFSRCYFLFYFFFIKKKSSPSLWVIFSLSWWHHLQDNFLNCFSFYFWLHWGFTALWGLFTSCGNGGHSRVVVGELLIVASLVVEHRL